MSSHEKMIDVNCSICNNLIQIPLSFLKKIPNEDTNSIPHICKNCIENIGGKLGNKKMESFLKEINNQMKKAHENDRIAELLAEEITNENIDSLLDELEPVNASEEEKITESFFRGVWISLFLIANNHEPGFLEKEIDKIKDFHETMKERENTK